LSPSALCIAVGRFSKGTTPSDVSQLSQLKKIYTNVIQMAKVVPTAKFAMHPQLFVAKEFSRRDGLVMASELQELYQAI
jgi:hypothetical protein